MAEVLLLTVSSQFLRLIVELGDVIMHLDCVDGATACFHYAATELKLLGCAELRVGAFYVLAKL